MRTGKRARNKLTVVAVSGGGRIVLVRGMTSLSMLSVFLIFGFACSGCGHLSQPVSIELSHVARELDSLWDDGLSEVAKYQAQRTVYGHPRDYDATLITVKEELESGS